MEPLLLADQSKSREGRFDLALELAAKSASNPPGLARRPRAFDELLLLESNRGARYPPHRYRTRAEERLQPEPKEARSTGGSEGTYRRAALDRSGRAKRPGVYRARRMRSASPVLCSAAGGSSMDRGARNEGARACGSRRVAAARRKSEKSYPGQPRCAAPVSQPVRTGLPPAGQDGVYHCECCRAPSASVGIRFSMAMAALPRLMSHAAFLELLDTGSVWSVARGLARNVQR